MDFYDVRTLAREYYDNNPGLDTVKGSGYKDFIRFETFWQDRVNKYGSYEGSHKFMIEALAGIFNNQSSYCDNNSIQANWENIGPKSYPEQKMGLIACVKPHPDYFTNYTIFAGSNSAGLWKTTDKGQTWTVLTDNIGLPGLAVSDLIFNPIDADIMYIATGISTLERGYGCGVLKTTDGGQSKPLTLLQKQSIKGESPGGIRLLKSAIHLQPNDRRGKYKPVAYPNTAILAPGCMGSEG